MSELYELPDGWKWIEFKNVFDNPTSKPYQIKKTEYLDSGKLPIVDQGQKFIIGYSNLIKKQYPNDFGCIIFGDHTRQIKYIDFNFVIGADGTKILKEKNTNLFDLKFLYFQLLSKEIKSLGYSRHFKLLKLMSFAIPPLQEQKRIVAKLDKLFEKIDMAIALHQKNMDEANVFMKSVLNDVFGELEEKYSLNQLGSLTKTTSGGTPRRSEKNYWNGDIGWLKSGELNDGYINDVDEFITEIGLQKSSAKIFPKGTLLIAMYGATVGKLGILNIKTSTNQAVCAILNDKNLFETLYMFYYLKKIRDKMIADSFGGAQPNISQTYLKELLIPLPPLNIQQKIVTYLDKISKKIENLKKVQKEKMQSLVASKASILDQAFRGEL